MFESQTSRSGSRNLVSCRHASSLCSRSTCAKGNRTFRAVPKTVFVNACPVRTELWSEYTVSPAEAHRFEKRPCFNSCGSSPSGSQVGLSKHRPAFLPASDLEWPAVPRNRFSRFSPSQQRGCEWPTVSGAHRWGPFTRGILRSA